MPIKKCKYCKTRMSRVIWGMSAPESYSRTDDSTEFGGCVTTGLDEDWRCDNCNSRVIRSHSPESGFCIEETPELLKVALQVFLNRLNKFSYKASGHRSKEFYEPASIKCSGENSELSVFGVHEHANRGDFLTVRVCKNVQLELHFNGSGRVFTQWAGLTGFGKFCETKMELEIPEFANLENKIEDLTSGYSILLRVLEEIPRHFGECSGYQCDHDADFGWKGLEGTLSLLDVESARLNRHFYPTGFEKV